MIPIVKHPRVVQAYAPFFKALFSQPQYQNFQKFLTGIIVGTNHTVTGINNRFVDRNDQSSLNRFLTTSPWLEDQVNHLRLNLLQGQGMEWRESGCISIDDVLIEKTGTKIVGVGKLFVIVQDDMLLLSNWSPATMWTVKNTIPSISFSMSHGSPGR